MSESAIRTQIYTILSNVTNIGKVYDYERWSADWASFINLFKTTISSVPQIRGWEIGRRGFGKEIMTVGGEEDPTSHEYAIYGYMAVQDAAATEKTFNALVESVLDVFKQNRTLSGAGYVDSIKGIIDTRMFGSVLCHCAEISLFCRERI